MLKITYDEWDEYININKQHMLDSIDNTLLIDKSQEHIQFINILKKIFNINIFNVSRITYSIFTFLHIYINKYLYDIINPNLDGTIRPEINLDGTIRPEINLDGTIRPEINLDCTISPEINLDNTIIPNLNNHNNNNNNNNIIIMLKLIIKLFINIEFILNTQFFLIIYILNKNKKKTTTTPDTPDTLDTPDTPDTPDTLDTPDTTPETKPETTNETTTHANYKILMKITQICKDIDVNIKSSTIILLLLKMNSQLCNYTILDIINNDLINNENSYSKTINIFNNDINNLLDKFINDISQIIEYTDTHTDTHTDTNTNTDIYTNTITYKYILCVNYILDLSNLLYSMFNTSIDIFITYLIKENPTHTNFYNIKNSISDLLTNEIQILKQTLLELYI